MTYNEWAAIDEITPCDGMSGLLVVDGMTTHGWYEVSQTRGARWVVGCEGFETESEPTHYMPWPLPPGEENR